MSRVLVLCPDHVGSNMAGPAIRYTEMSRALSRFHEVTLGLLDDTPYELPGVKTIQYGPRNIEKLINDHDAVLVSGFQARSYPVLFETDRAIIADIYDPFVLENLELDSRRQDYAVDTAVQNDILRLGDFFICASERQRDFWLGAFAALHRLNPEIYAEDKTLRNLVDVVSFGIPAEPPVRKKAVLKGAYPGINPDDKVILWGGGLYDWLDPLTLIRAMAEIGRARGDIKLFFMGIKHPNPSAPEMKVVGQAIKLSKEIGLLDKTVFFNDWVPYEERADYLLEADLGVSLHLEHAETRFSFRTRVLDYIWAALPVVATEGDAMADIISGNGLGRTVAYGSVSEAAGAITDLLGDDGALKRCRDSFAKVQQEFMWENVIKPLAAFCDKPVHRPVARIDSTEIEDLRSGLAMLTAEVADKTKHIRNLESFIEEKDALLDDFDKTVNRFPGSWLHQITRGYRFVTGQGRKKDGV